MKGFESSLSDKELCNYVIKQVDFFFPDGAEINNSFVFNCVQQALYRIRISFEPLHLRYYNKGTSSFFNHLHGDHYSAFLFLLSNEAYKAGNESLAQKLFLLNKSLFGIDAFYSLSLPEHFLFVHPLGTILGNANYGDFFIVYQGVTVGSTTQGIYPSFDVRTILYANSSIIGSCVTGTDFVLAANASLINCNVSDSKVVIGNYPYNNILDNEKKLIRNYYSL